MRILEMFNKTMSFQISGSTGEKSVSLQSDKYQSVSCRTGCYCNQGVMCGTAVTEDIIRQGTLLTSQTLNFEWQLANRNPSCYDIYCLSIGVPVITAKSCTLIKLALFRRTCYRRSWSKTAGLCFLSTSNQHIRNKHVFGKPAEKATFVIS
jgi:hypothetical protein